MLQSIIFIGVIELLIILLSLSIGHSILLIRLRKEENKKKELELALLEKRTELFQEGNKLAKELEELLYKAKVEQEINEIIRKNQKQ